MSRDTDYHRNDYACRMAKLIYGDDVARFWSYVDKDSAETGCWLWTGCLDEKNRPIFRVKGKNVYAYRWAYTQFVKAIPSGYTIDHVWDKGCRFTYCVNYEAHLEPVTMEVNRQRMLAAGRNPRGASHGMAKVNPEIVRELRARWNNGHGEQQKLLAAEFDLTQGTVGKIVRRELWKAVMP